LDGILNISDTSLFPAGGYRLFNYTGTLTNNGLIIGGQYIVLDTSVAGQVNLMFVPEPSSLCLLSLGAVLVWRRRRNRQAKLAGKQIS
jgi:hypothetical protein